MTAALALLKRREEMLRRRLRDCRSAGSRCIGDDALKMLQRVVFDMLEDELRFTEEAIVVLESTSTSENP